MTRLVWALPGSRRFDAGLDRGVLYPRTGPGVPWNGLISIDEAPSGGDLESLYYDGVKYLDVIASEDFHATLEAFGAPDEFAACDGVKTLVPGLSVTHQPRETFGLSYRTLIGNDIQATIGYKLHIVYGCTASPAGVSYQTKTQATEAGSKQWEINSVPPPANTYKPTAHLIIDSTKISGAILAELEALLYGDATTTPSLPSQTTIIGVLSG